MRKNQLAAHATSLSDLGPGPAPSEPAPVVAVVVLWTRERKKKTTDEKENRGRGNQDGSTSRRCRSGHSQEMKRRRRQAAWATPGDAAFFFYVGVQYWATTVRLQSGVGFHDSFVIRLRSQSPRNPYWSKTDWLVAHSWPIKGLNEVKFNKWTLNGILKMESN